LREDGAIGSLAEAAHGGVAVQSDDQAVAVTAGVAKRSHVAEMEEVEATIREDDRAAGSTVLREGSP
jgi:hypothetical protein